MTDELEIVDEISTDLELRPQGGVFATRDPGQMIEQATKVADALMGLVEKRGLKSTIGGKDYLQVEAWTTLGVMVGCTARTEWTRPVSDGWEAAVEVVNSSGMVIGRAEAECLRSERNWKTRDDYALRSMAQTRAMGKALRMPLGWIAVLAGYAATPAEEMAAEATERPSQPRRDRRAPSEQGPQTWADVRSQIQQHVADWKPWLEAAAHGAYNLEMPASPADLPDDVRTGLFASLQLVCDLLAADGGPVEPEQKVRAAFAAVFDGAAFDVPYEAPVPFE